MHVDQIRKTRNAWIGNRLCSYLPSITVVRGRSWLVVLPNANVTAVAIWRILVTTYRLHESSAVSANVIPADSKQSTYLSTSLTTRGYDLLANCLGNFSLEASGRVSDLRLKHYLN